MTVKELHICKKYESRKEQHLCDDIIPAKMWRCGEDTCRVISISCHFQALQHWRSLLFSFRERVGLLVHDSGLVLDNG